MEESPYLSIKSLAAYSGLGVRTLRAHLIDPAHPLPHYRVGGKILVRRCEFDEWMAVYRRIGDEDVKRVVADVLSSLS